MKINIEIDCTPEEARRFLGLPDLQPLHDIYLMKMEGLMSKGITPDLMQDVIKNWVPMGETGLNALQSLFGQFAGGMMGGASGGSDSKPKKPAKD